MLPESLAMRNAGERAPFARPLFHLHQVLVDSVMPAQPTSLAGVLRQHGYLAIENGGHVDHKAGTDEILFRIAPTHRIHEIEVRYGVQRIAAGLVIRCGRGETGVARESAGGFMVAMVIDGRGSQDDVRPRLAQRFSYASPSSVVVEDCQVAHFQAYIIRADVRCRSGCLTPAEIRNVGGAQFMRAAVAGCEGRDGDRVPRIGQERQGTAGQDLHVVRVGVNGENANHALYCHLVVE